MSEEQRRKDLRESSDQIAPAEYDIDRLLERVRRTLIVESAVVTLIALILCTLVGSIAVVARGEVWHQEPLLSMLRGTPATRATGSDVIIGIPLSITGQQSREGGFAKRGYDLWLDWINGRGGISVGNVRHRVRAIYRDDQSNPDVSAHVTQALITDDKAQFLLGSSGAATVATEAAVAEKNGVPLVEGSAPALSIFSHGYKYTFGVLSPANLYVNSIVDMASAQSPRPTRVALLAADDPFSQEVAAMAADYLSTKGFTVVFNQRYPNGSTDVSRLVAEAKANAPDILLDAGHLAEAVAINKAAKDVKLDVKILGYTIGPSLPDFTQALGKDADYTYGASQWTPHVRYKASFYLSVQDYVAAYKRKYNTAEDPHYHVAGATAAGLALERAIEQAGSIQPDRVRAGLARLDVETFYGRLRFDPSGINSMKPMLVEQIQGGRPHTVWPATMSDAPPRYPMPPWT